MDSVNVRGNKTQFLYNNYLYKLLLRAGHSYHGLYSKTLD